MITYCLVMALLASSVRATEELHLKDYEYTESQSDPRLFFANFTSSLIQVNSTLLAYALVGLALVGAAALALYYLYLQSANSSAGYGQYSYSQYGYQSRSSNEGWGFNAMNVIQWISMLQDVYEKFDYNDVECQKRLICEVLKEEEYFGDVSRNLKSGFQLVKYLEVMNLPDEFRELLDEYMDASERSLGQKQCEEFFQCPYSLKDAVKRNFSGNSL